MEALICDACGGSLISDGSGEYFVCEFCGTKHTRSRVQSKLQEVKGVVEVYSGNQEKENQFEIASNLLKSGNREEAHRYYCQLSDKYPDDYRSWLGRIQTETLVPDWRSACSPERFMEAKDRILLSKDFRMAISLAPEQVKSEIIAYQEQRNNEFEFIVKKDEIESELKSLRKKLDAIDDDIAYNNKEKESTREWINKCQGDLSRASIINGICLTAILLGGIIFALSVTGDYPAPVLTGLFLIIVGIIVLGKFGIWHLIRSNKSNIANSNKNLMHLNSVRNTLDNQWSELMKKIQETEAKLNALHTKNRT